MRAPHQKMALIISLVLILTACSGGDNGTSEFNKLPDSERSAANITFYKNQVGYLPLQQKLIIVKTNTPMAFSVRNMNSGKLVLNGVTSHPTHWTLANENASIADVSGITASGHYRLEITNTDYYTTFKVSTARVEALHDASIKAYYYNRASTVLDTVFAGKWHRAASHHDTHVINLNNPQQIVSSPKGWFDAGDYNKYIVNSGISTYTLMRAYLDFPKFYEDRQWNIPESTNSTPDILDEVRWNVDWMLTMQDADGGVFHKLTTLNFAQDIMPSDATEQRYLVGKSTAATLNFAAVMATASRIYPDKSTIYLAAAQKAWQWALANPKLKFVNPGNVATGEYGDNSFTDEFAWAAAELFLATGNKNYLTAMDSYIGEPSTPSWSDSMGLVYLSLLSSEGQALLKQERLDELKNQLLAYATTLVDRTKSSPFNVAMASDDFVWGSNGVAMNHAVILSRAYTLTDNVDYYNTMAGLLDYVLGKNPTGYSFVTGHGEKTPMFIHHRQSRADDVSEPIPGFLVGGPQNGQQDLCDYDSSLPATSYLDDWCSYSTNEVAINWNAPLVYSLAALLNTGS